MSETPQLPPSQRYGAAGNPLPLRKERGGWLPNRRETGVLIVLWILAVAVRLVWINQPYVDHWSWRQSDVAAIARNFFEHAFHFGYPQIDWAGGSAGFVGTEFPILPFLAAICYKFAGIQEWIGRSQSVIFFAISLPFFFLLVRETFSSTAAIWATFFYAFAPLNIFAGRSFMPDVPSLSLGIIGLYFFLRWTEHRASLCAPSPESFRGCPNIRQNARWAHRLKAYVPFFISAIAISLSILVKATSIVIAAPILYLVVAAVCDRRLQERFGAHRAPLQIQLAIFAAIILVPSAIWYWHAYQIAESFYPHHFFGAGGVRLENFSWYWDIAQKTVTSSLTPVLAIMALIGLFIAPRGKFGSLFDWWLAAMVLFAVAVGYGNRHPWYQLAFVPIAAAFAGAACAFLGSKISSRLTVVTLSTLVAGTFAILAFLYVRLLYEPSAAQHRNAGLELNKITPSNALIVAVDNGNPAIFYYAKRKGWHFLEQNGVYGGNPENGQQAIRDLERLRGEGATHLVFVTNTFWWLRSYPELTQHLSETATPLEATPEFQIYELKARDR